MFADRASNCLIYIAPIICVEILIPVIGAGSIFRTFITTLFANYFACDFFGIDT
jgi:hypothetical protein